MPKEIITINDLTDLTTAEEAILQAFDEFADGQYVGVEATAEEICGVLESKTGRKFEIIDLVSFRLAWRQKYDLLLASKQSLGQLEEIMAAIELLEKELSENKNKPESDAGVLEIRNELKKLYKKIGSVCPELFI